MEKKKKREQAAKEDVQMANKQNRKGKVHNVITYQANVCIKKPQNLRAKNKNTE